ncbi:hypothetical protein R1sor_004435 [Riccia sorocarpa]|uniref:Uncharacterized protein n=1 Tax=Riccia sorocarpa TaxID=122646 RepID=A0ABD3HN30_9MARC
MGTGRAGKRGQEDREEPGGTRAEPGRYERSREEPGRAREQADREGKETAWGRPSQVLCVGTGLLGVAMGESEPAKGWTERRGGNGIEGDGGLASLCRRTLLLGLTSLCPVYGMQYGVEEPGVKLSHHCGVGALPPLSREYGM